MISKLQGNVVHMDKRFFILDVSGVGYKVYTTENTLEKVSKEKKGVSMWTHLAVREDALDLYGFLTQDELDFFEMLIGISGIGPKTALSVLNVANIKDIEEAIATGNTSHLTKVSGVGKKIAEKIVLELRGKIGAREEKNGTHLKDEIDTLEALKALGYSHSESRDALQNIPKTITGTSEKVRHALKQLGSGHGSRK